MTDNLNRTYFTPQPGQLLLDVGAADGHNSADLHSLGYDVTALEIDPDLVVRLAADPRNRGVHAIRSDATAMPFVDSCFDRVILLEVLEHVEATERVLAEIHRVLRPGGIFCVGVPTSYTERLFGRLHPRYAENATHVKIFDRAALSAALEGAGFEVRAIETQNFIPAVSWLFHALLRSDAAHTGEILEHRVVDRLLNPIFSVWSRLPVLRRSFAFVSTRVGKSWYFYCVKA